MPSADGGLLLQPAELQRRHIQVTVTSSPLYENRKTWGVDTKEGWQRERGKMRLKLGKVLSLQLHHDSKVIDQYRKHDMCSAPETGHCNDCSMLRVLL